MKINAILDCNYLLMKNVFTLIKNNCLYGDFHRMMDMNLNKYMKAFDYDRMVLVSDSRRKSWRKRVLDKYKEHRKKDEEIDWEWIFVNYAEWKKKCVDEHGCFLLEGDGVEGDDWIAAFLQSSWKEGDSNVVVSSDRDLCQLLKWNDAQINLQIEDTSGREKIFFPVGYQIYVSNLKEADNSDPFSLNNSCAWEQTLNGWMNSYEIQEWNAKELLAEKLVKGDKGDNIDSVYQKIIKNGKVQNIGDGGARKVWSLYSELYDEHYNSKSEEFLNRLAECVCSVNKLDFDVAGKGIVKKLEQNRQLIELHHRHWPEDIKEKIIEGLETVLN